MPDVNKDIEIEKILKESKEIAQRAELEEKRELERIQKARLEQVIIVEEDRLNRFFENEKDSSGSLSDDLPELTAESEEEETVVQKKRESEYEKRFGKKKQPVMPEIFSNASKEPRLKSQTPLDMEFDAQPSLEDINTEEIKAPGNDAVHKSGADNLTRAAAGYINNDTHGNPFLIDRDADFAQNNYEKRFGTPKPVISEASAASKLPFYQHESKVNVLNIKAGKFSQVVKAEYEAYRKIKQVYETDGTHTRQVDNEENDDYELRKPRTAAKLLQGVAYAFGGQEEPDEETNEEFEKTVTLEDYNSPEDTKSVLFEINKNIKKMFGRSVLMFFITAAALIMSLNHRAKLPFSVLPSNGSAVMFCAVNFSLLLLSIAACSVTVINGIKPLRRLRGNSDTAVALVSIIAFIQSVFSLFDSMSFYSASFNLYALLAIFALLFNTVGKFYIVRRVKQNFRFLTSQGNKYAAKIYTGESLARKMMSGTVVEKPIIAYQHKSGFFSNFLKISYAPDPSEDMASKIAPYTALLSVIAGAVYGFMSGNFTSGISAAAVTAAISVPICTLLSVNVPMRRLCRQSQKEGAMISGYLSVKQFCDSTAVIADACDLYPQGTIVLNGIKTFHAARIDESLLYAASILKAAESPQMQVFENILEDNKSILPEVESYIYEDGLGLVGWIKGERILIGTRTLLDSYGVEVPTQDFEKKHRREGRQLTYISHSGQLVAMLVTTYRADLRIATECRRAEYNGISLIVRTTDCNITNERIAEDFGVYFRSVKVLPTGLGNACRDATAQVAGESRAYIVTRGRISSLLRAISGSVRMKNCISIAVIIQLISIILGLIFTLSILFYSGVNRLGDLELFSYMAIWAFAGVFAPLLHKT